MRIFIATCALALGIPTLGTLHAAPAEKTLPAEQQSKGKKAPAGPRLGVKTPGVLIPYALLKTEAELPEPGKPAWMFFSESLYVPGRDSIEKINAKTNKPGDPIAGVNQPCSGMISAFKSLWVASCANKTVLRIDPKTAKITNTVESGVGSAFGGLAASGDSVWILSDDKVTLSRIDPDQNAVVGELRLPVGCKDLTFGETALWVACPDQNQVLRINVATSLVETAIDVSATPQAIAIGDASIFVFCKKDGKVDRIDPKTNKVIKTIDLEVPGLDGSIAFGEGSLWVSQTGYPITRINTTLEKEKVMQQFHGDAGGAIITSAGALWMSDFTSGKLLRIDPKRVIATLAE